MKNQYTGDWNSSKFSKTSFLKKKNHGQNVYLQSYYNTHHQRELPSCKAEQRKCNVQRMMILMENISVCNTMQKQTHYEYYYFNKLIQVYKARKSNIAFHSTQHSTIISWSSGCVQNLIKVFKSTQSFFDRELSQFPEFGYF